VCIVGGRVGRGGSKLVHYGKSGSVPVGRPPGSKSRKRVGEENTSETTRSESRIEEKATHKKRCLKRD